MIGVAPVYSLTDEPAHAESVAWAQFSGAKDTAEFCVSWLAILCMQIGRVGGALLLLGPNEDGAYVPAAVWPQVNRDLQYLTPAAERTLNERRGLVVAPDGSSMPARDQRAFVGYPIEVAGVLHGAVVLDLAPGPEAGLQRALRLLHWASAWLIDQFRSKVLEQSEARLLRLGLVMELVATALQESRALPAAVAVVNELAGRLDCDRVSIGFERSGGVEVKAISHTAAFDPKMNLARMVAEAMDEVLDLDVAIVYPADGEEIGAIAHAELAREFRDIAICSVPLLEDGHATGVLTLERSSGAVFGAETVEVLKTLGGVLGPILGLKRDSERGMWQRGWSRLRVTAQTLFGPRHPGVKLIALVVASVLLFFSVATATYRVSARTVVEGAVQRVIASPFDGYILESAVRAGDTVRKDQLLARLDDRDLGLEQTRLTSEREQALRKHRQALATGDRSTMAVLAAQVEEIDAALSLVTDKLRRARLVAPFDGIVVSGDLSQLLGTPVELGKTLFQVAPLDAYRVILEIDERDIAQLSVGQHGDLTLTGIPNEYMDFTVQQITPISTAQEGRNFFRVEAHLQSPSDRVRPGMEGVGKIAAGERRLIWIWTHTLVDWLRLSAWKWMP